MNDPDREAKTPRTSGSFALFHSMALDLAQRLESASRVMSKRIEQLDIAGAKRAAAMSRELRDEAERFARWPEMSPETVALERVVLVPRLLELQREGEELLSRMRT